MQLSVQERFALLDLLPQAGDFTTLRVIRELKEALSFSDQEHEILKFQILENDRVTWEHDMDLQKWIGFGWKQEEIIRAALQDADKKKKLKMDHLSIYEKFFPEAPDG
jgi:hypothetical protein